MKRLFDLSMSFILIILLSPLFLLISSLILFSSGRPIVFFSKRAGINDSFFYMPKFRTMKVKTPQLATHLLENPDSYTTYFGNFLRKSSLDELPQFFSVLVGNMSFIGPRPALFNQNDLINLRKKNNLNNQKPGITGWAQINGRDELTIEEKVRLEKDYLKQKSIKLDIKILLMTLKKVFLRQGVKH